METMSLADVFWPALVVTGVVAEALERRKARRAGSVAPYEGPLPLSAAGQHVSG